MKRLPWDIVFALLFGLAVGLVYSWIISPLSLTNTEPALLRTDFKNQFREVIAASYSYSGNLARAQARLSILGDSDPILALNAQAQQNTANGRFIEADQLAALAVALENGGNPITTAPRELETTPEINENLTPLPSPDDLPIIVTETPEFFETQPTQPQVNTINTAAPRPTRTPIPTQGAPFLITALDTVCDPNIPEGLLQVTVFNPNRRQMPGVKILINWENGGEQFFTGLKPELGNGYADFLMASEISYSVQLAMGSETITDLVAPTCQTISGDFFIGGYKLSFQQP